MRTSRIVLSALVLSLLTTTLAAQTPDSASIALRQIQRVPDSLVVSPRSTLPDSMIKKGSSNNWGKAAMVVGIVGAVWTIDVVTRRDDRQGILTVAMEDVKKFLNGKRK